MKQAHNNQVDLLLRSLARGRQDAILPRRSNSGEGNPATSDHLDADELNSYAEGMVPAPARIRYIEHLADCDLCRGMVVNLTQAAGIATRSEAPEQKRGSTVWQKLATVFSPAVLRFAVPALVLTAVIGIGFLAMLQQRQREYVAKNEPAASAPPKVQLQTETPDTQSGSDAPLAQQRAVASPDANEALKREKSVLDDRVNAKEDETRTGTGEVAGSVAASRDAIQPAEAGNRMEKRPGYAPEPKAEPPPPPVSTMAEADKGAPLAKEQNAKLEERERQQDYYKNTAPSDEHGPNRAAAPRSGAALSNRRLDDQPAGRGGPYSPKKDSKVGEKANEAETRVVSGRRFAREGNAWVDSAYDASRTPVRVARGSEQFRALVADEPGLRAIADQLSGVVIVVWKNRAYRIQ